MKGIFVAVALFSPSDEPKRWEFLTSYVDVAQRQRQWSQKPYSGSSNLLIGTSLGS